MGWDSRSRRTGSGSVTGLGGMRRGDDSVPLSWTLIRRRCGEVADLAHDQLDAANCAGRLGDPLEALAVAGEDLDADSSSSSMMALDTPGCEVCRALAASVRFRLPHRLLDRIEWCRFMTSGNQKPGSLSHRLSKTCRLRVAAHSRRSRPAARSPDRHPDGRTHRTDEGVERDPTAAGGARSSSRACRPTPRTGHHQWPAPVANGLTGSVGPGGQRPARWAHRTCASGSAAHRGRDGLHAGPGHAGP